MVQSLPEDYTIGKLYVRHIDPSNDGLFIRIKRGGAVIEMEVELEQPSED
jgi:hypothetical protein